jgi:hypothetical protein
MRTIKNFLALTAITASLIAQSCTAQPEKKDTTIIQSEKNEIEVERLRQEEMAITLKFEEYRNKINRDIDENEKAIDELKERSKKMEKKQQVDYDKSIQSLEDQNKLLKEKANAYKRTAGQNWDVFQREFNDDLAKFGKALKDFTIRNEKK